MCDNHIVAILPCGGLQIRMKPFRYPKELLPIFYENIPGEKFVRPKLSIEYSLHAFTLAEIERCFIIVPDWKPEIMKYLGDGSELGIQLAYLNNSNAAGLADAIFTSYSWANKSITCFSMPDTQFYPQNAFVVLLEKLKESGADLVLGVFPTDNPEALAPVEIGPNGLVLSVEDKPTRPKYFNTWGIAIWTPNFWKFYHSFVKGLPPGSSVSEIFNKAARMGLKVYAVDFEHGEYIDIGMTGQVGVANATKK